MLVPSHRYTHEFIWIAPGDDSWNTDKTNAEEQAIARGESEWASVREHPMTRYWSGESRCDLATVKQYLLPDKQPTMFRLRRLPLSQWAAIQQLEERGLNVQARIERVRFGLAGIDNGPNAIGLTPGALADADIAAVKEMLGDTVFGMLSNAIHACNRDLGPSELFR